MPMLYIEACSPMAIMCMKEDWYPYLSARNILENEFKRHYNKIEYTNFLKAKEFINCKLNNDDDKKYSVEVLEHIINEAVNMMYNGIE